MSLAYLLANTQTLTLVGDEGTCGEIQVSLIPCHKNGDEIEENDSIFEELDFVDNPNTLIGHPLHFKIVIGEVTLPEVRRVDPILSYTVKNYNEEG